METNCPTKYTKTNNVSHPVRPSFQENEILYTTDLHNLDTSLRLRVISIVKDLEIFHEWHNQTRIANFWELNKSKEELLKYLTNGLQDAHQMPVIVEFKKQSDYEQVGYFEIYWTKEDRLGAYYEAHDFDRGFHLLIGNTKFLGFENTDAILKHVCHYIFQSNKATLSIMGEPRHDNQKILRYLETFTAWERIKEIEFPHKKAILLRCDRTKFYEKKYV